MDHAYQLLDALLLVELEAARQRAIAETHAQGRQSSAQEADAEERLEDLADQGDAASAKAQAREEARVLAEAHAIAAGRSAAEPTREHVRLLVARLERRAPSATRGAQEEAPF